MSNLIDDDDMTEVRNANMPRVDLVDKAANGTSFLIMKAESPNLISTEMVEELLKQAEEPPMKEAAPVDIVAKADDELLVTDGVTPLDATKPGSAGWETIDAQTAEEVYAQIVRLKNMLDLLAGREATEAATGDSDDDGETVWNLEDAAGALDYAGDVVAVYAAGENAEAEEADSVAKALSAIPAGALSTVDLLGSIKKAGRTLSASNEQKLVSASESIQSVLASLPAAPEDVTKKGATVSDQETTTEPTVEALVKADDPAAKTAVFNAAGKLVGIVDPTAIEPITGATVDDADTADDTEEAPAAPAADVAPAPVDPNAPIAKADDPEDVPLTKAAVEDLIKGALDTARAEDAAVIKGLSDQVEFLKAPARSKVVTNGATGLSAVTRDGVVVEAGLQKSAEDLRKASANALDTQSKTKIDDERQSRAVAMLSGQLRAV